MDYKVYIFSENVLNGITNFDLKKLNFIFARTLTTMSRFEILPLDSSKNLTLSQNNIIFSENENLDNIIIDLYSQLGSEKEIIDEQLVVFNKAGVKTIFIPLESDIELLHKILYTNEKLCQFHVFGMNKNEIINKLEEIKNEVSNLTYKVIENNILCDVYLSYKGQGDVIDDNLVKIASIFKANMYSENELTLENIVFQLLKMKNLSISICENVTQGKILASLLEKNECFSNVLKLGKVEFYDKIDNDFLHTRTTEILNESGSDIAIMTCGIKEENKFNFTFTIADKKEVHFYKCNFTGNIESSIEMAKNTVLFHLVKKLRQNDFVF